MDLQEKLAEILAMMETEPVCEAAKAICRARCSIMTRAAKSRAAVVEIGNGIRLWLHGRLPSHCYNR